MRFLSLLAVLLLSSCGFHSVMHTSGYSFDKAGELRSRPETGSLPATMTSIEIDQRFGEVKVLVAAGDPSFEWKLSCWGKTAEDAERFLTEITLERTESAGAHRFQLVLPEDPGSKLRGVESELTVHVPVMTRVLVRNSFGGVEVRGISGKVSGDCSHCSIELVDLSDSVEWKTSFNDLTATRIGGGELQNSHGEVVVDTVTGDLVAETSFAAARITGVRGSLEVENSHGKLSIERVDGTLTAKTSFSNLIVDGVGGDATLRNSHGSIEARSIVGEVDAETSFAGLQLESGGERVKVENSHGRIDITLTGPVIRHVEAETSFSNLEIRLPGGLHPALFIDQKYGEISCPLPVLLAGGNSSPVAAGAPQVHLKVRHGDIEVSEGRGN